MLKSVISRILLWYKVVKGCKGLDRDSVENLFTSALVDVLNLLAKKSIRNPVFRRSGSYLIKPYGVIVYARGATEDLYFAIPKREGLVDDFIRAKLKHGDIFVDVGANIGYYTLLGSILVGDDGKVIALEPIPETVKVLKLNLKLNNSSNVIVVGKAAWHRKESIPIELPDGFFGSASAVAHYKNAKSLQVDGIPMDDMLESYPRIKLIKIDVEGAELQVLKGLRHTLPKTAYLVLEASTHKDKIIDLLNSHGFVHQYVGSTDYVICFNRWRTS